MVQERNRDVFTLDNFTEGSLASQWQAHDAQCPPSAVSVLSQPSSVCRRSVALQRMRNTVSSVETLMLIISETVIGHRAKLAGVTRQDTGAYWSKIRGRLSTKSLVGGQRIFERFLDCKQNPSRLEYNGILRHGEN